MAPNSKQAPLAVVTAGARRLGKAMVLRLAERGFDIALHHNSSNQEAKETAAQVEQAGRRCALFPADFSNTQDVESLLPSVRSAFQTEPALLINNASVFVQNKLSDVTPAQFDLDMNVHVRAPLILIQGFARGTSSGNIINIVDTAITRASSDYFSYLLTKKALYELTRMAAYALAPGIRVNAIAPGIIIAPVGIDKDKYERLAAGNLLQRSAGPIDVLKAMDYLLDSPQVTGECLFVDGGDHLT